MIDTQVETIRTSFNALAKRGEEVAERFYANLFAAQPALKSLFPRNASERDNELIAWLGMVVKNLHRIDSMLFLLEDAGKRCQRAGVQPQQFGNARDALISAMRETARHAGPDELTWDAQLESDWVETLNIIVSLMIRGAGRARARAA